MPDHRPARHLVGGDRLRAGRVVRREQEPQALPVGVPRPPVFAEALAAEIAGEIFDTAKATSVTVTLTQRPAAASRSAPPPNGVADPIRTMRAAPANERQQRPAWPGALRLLALEPRLAGCGRRAQGLAARRHDDERHDVGQHRDELVGDLVEAQVHEQGSDAGHRRDRRGQAAVARGGDDAGRR